MPKIAIAFLVVLLALPLGLYAWLDVIKPATKASTRLRYMAWGTPEQQAAEQSQLSRFMELHPDIHVDFIVVPGESYLQKLQLMLASRTEPDVYRVIGSAYPQYATLGYFTDLQPFIDSDPTFKLSDFVPQALAEETFQGKVLSIEAIFGGRMIFYNKKMIAAAGLEDPYAVYLKGEWTFDRFVQYGQAMTNINPASGMPSQIGMYLDAGTDIYWIVWGFGGEIFDKATNTVHVDEPNAIKGMQFFADLEHKYHVQPMPSQAGLGQWSFESGKVGMFPNWVGGAAGYRTIKSFDWDVVPTPEGPAGRICITQGNALVMSHITTHPHESWELLKFMTGDEAQSIVCSDQCRRCTPTRKDLVHSETFLKSTQPPFNTGAYLPLYDKSKPIPVTATSNRWSPDFSRWMDRMMTDDPARMVSPTDAANGMARDIRGTLARPEDE